MDITIGPFWNKKQLEPPAVVSLKIGCPSAERTSAALAEILEKILSVLNDQELLHKDAAIISRLLFRTKRTLRRDKGYKCFQKVWKHLSRYLSLDLLSIITQIRNTAYGTFGPSREVLEWGLLNIKRFSILFHTLEGICQETGYFMNNHITTGDYWSLALVFLSCLGRIWTISRYLVSQACEWYMSLQAFLPFLTCSERWLPNDYELPTDLKSWLGNPAYIEMTCTENPDTQASALSFNEDFGEVISRSSKSSNTGESKFVKPKIEIDVPFENCEDIAKFIKNEQKWRQIGSSSSRTKHLSETEWQKIKKFLRKVFVDLMSLKDKETFNKTLDDARKQVHKWMDHR